jgi:hypothetical protein
MPTHAVFRHRRRAAHKCPIRPNLATGCRSGPRSGRLTSPKRFVGVRRAAGLGHFRLHDLRHFVATQMLGAGVPIPIVAARLCHARGGKAQKTLGANSPHEPAGVSPSIQRPICAHCENGASLEPLAPEPGDMRYLERARQRHFQPGPDEYTPPLLSLALPSVIPSANVRSQLLRCLRLVSADCLAGA